MPGARRRPTIRPPPPGALAQERAAAARAEQAWQQQQQDLAAAKAARWWRAARPVDAQHPYVRARGIVPYGARQWHRWLLLPLSRHGALCTLQLIAPDGSKRFLRGGAVRDAGLWLGETQRHTTLLLCEGWATGCSLHEASRLPVLVAFSAHNLLRLAQQLATHGQCTTAVVRHSRCGSGHFWI